MRLANEKLFVSSAAFFTDRLLSHPALKQSAIDIISKLTPQEIVDQLPDILDKLQCEKENRNRH